MLTDPMGLQTFSPDPCSLFGYCGPVPPPPAPKKTFCCDEEAVKICKEILDDAGPDCGECLSALGRKGGETT
jgi:hypothetical protein